MYVYNTYFLPDLFRVPVNENGATSGIILNLHNFENFDI